MERKNLQFLMSCVLLTAVLLALPFDTFGRTNVPLRAYGGGIDEDQVVEVPQGEGYPPLRFPVDQLLLLAAEGVEHRAMVDLIAGLADTVVIGQVPSIGVYQVRIGAATVAGLEQRMAALEALPEIEVAGPNLIGSQRSDVGSCPVCPDVCDLPAQDLLPYEQVGYLIALEIMKYVENQIPIDLHPVTIGLLENGYGGFAEFEDLTIENVSQWAPGSDGRLPFDADNRHGAAVTGIIAADNDGRGVNGIANTLLGDRLRVAMAKTFSRSVTDWFVGLENLVLVGGADIVNFSAGTFVVPLETACFNPYLRAPVRSWIRFLTNYPDVLFVTAAANRRVRYGVDDCGGGVTMPNAAPDGINLPNTLTVTASSHDNAGQRVLRAGYGSTVEISAPGENLAVVGLDGAIAHDSGTSFSTPMVSSAAAMLKSVGGPSMGPARIKDLLLNAENCCNPTRPEAGVQLSFAYPLVDLLWEEHGSTVWGAALFGAQAAGLHGAYEAGPILPPFVVGRFCTQGAMTVGRFGEFFFEQGQYRIGCDSSLSANLVDDRWSIGGRLFATNGDYLDFVGFLTTPQPFALHQPISSSESNLVVWDQRHMNRATCDLTRPCVGCWSATGGEGQFTAQFTGCRVLERTNVGAPRLLSIDIEFDAPRLLGRQYTLSEEGPDVEEIEFGPVHGSVRNVMSMSETPFSEDIDAVCSGLQHDNP